jgi:hypothetical protein
MYAGVASHELGRSGYKSGYGDWMVQWCPGAKFMGRTRVAEKVIREEYDKR